MQANLEERDMMEARSQLAKDFDDGMRCIRFRDKNGVHKASIAACDYNINDEGNYELNCDLCLPNGEVLYCGINEYLLSLLINIFGTEPVEKK
jgi:hypothetical protein